MDSPGNGVESTSYWFLYQSATIEHPVLIGSAGLCVPELPDGSIECSICLQCCIHPVQLPCSHIFCFLCVKGIANHSKRCALCRSEIPPDFLLRPMLLNADDVLRPTQAFDGKFQWFYEGVRGWWQYDVRASTEIEDRYQKGERIFEMLIAGFLYIVDMENMVQYRRNAPSRRRRIKRDLVDIPDKKGVAGLSCKLRPPRRTGGDGGEREDAMAVAAARSASGGGSTSQSSAAGAANNAKIAVQVDSVQQQMLDLTLMEGNGGTNDGNPQGSRSGRASGSRLAAPDGVDRDIRANSRAADAGPALQIETRSRSNRVNRQTTHHEAASVNGQPNQGARVNRVNYQSVDSQSSFGSRPSRHRDIDGHDAAARNSHPSSSARINSRVYSAGPEGSTGGAGQLSASARINPHVPRPESHTTGQLPSLNSRDNPVTSPVVDMLLNRQRNEGAPGADEQGGVSHRVEVTTNNSESISSVVIREVDNEMVADRTTQPVVSVVQNRVETATRYEPAALYRVGQASLSDVQGVSPVSQASHSDVQGASSSERSVEGKVRMDHVDGSSDSD